MKELWKDKSLWTASFICLTAMAFCFPNNGIELPLETGSFLRFFQKMIDNKTILFLIPVASVLPTGGAYVRESAGGFLRLYITRIDRMDYIKRKTVQIYAGGFLTLFLAGAAALTFCFLGLYPLELKGSITWEMVWESISLLLRISLVGGITAELSGIFAAVFQNYYLAYGLPFVSFYMLIILKERYFSKMYALYPAEWVKCQQYWGTGHTGIWIFLAVSTAAVMLLHGLVLYGRLREI